MESVGMIERRVTVQGVSTLYFDVGEGPVILFLHGNATSARDWSRPARTLATTHRVLVLALPGFGDSDPVEDVRPERLVPFIAAFLDELGVEQVVAAGHSYGGLLAAELALTRPERVTRLVLADSAGLGRAVHPLLIAQSLIPPPVAELLIAALLLPGAGAVRTLATTGAQLRQPWRVPLRFWSEQLRLSHSRTFLRTSFATVRAGTGLTGQRFVVTGRLRDLTIPTLVIWGLTDEVFPVWQAVSAVRRLPAGRLSIIPGAGHGSYVECHEEFLDALGPFVRAGALAG